MHTPRLSRAFVFGGTYGNLQATRAMLEQAYHLGFSPQEIIFTGDSVAYCADPEATARLIIDAGIPAIMGNCEEALANDSADCGCGFEEGSACDLLSVQWFGYCRAHISAYVRQWMASLPRSLVVEIGKFRLLCTHATPDSINRFVFASDFATGKFSPLDGPYDGYVTGHSGIPFATGTNGKCWINTGAAGMPANDGTSRVWYGIIEQQEDELVTRLLPLSYDHPAAISSMEKNGLPTGYAQCLADGLWPSHDILPEVEKNAGGRALEETTFRFCRKTGHAPAEPASPPDVSSSSAAE